jgi:nucleotide-binding universal stress UspA family protein
MSTSAPIIAATDHSHPAERAVARAAAIAQHHHVPLETLHATSSDPVAEILDRARSTVASLVVMGAIGAGNAKDFLSTSVSAKVLRRSTSPVLIVRSPPEVGYQRVCVLVDFSPASRTAIRAARYAAPMAHIVLCHALGLSAAATQTQFGMTDPILTRHHDNRRAAVREKLEILATKCGLAAGQYDVLIHDGSVMEVIEGPLADVNVDLVVTAKHGQGRLTELILGSITRQVLAKTVTDVLVVTDES